MKGNFFKRAAAMLLALAIMSGITPFESVSDKLGMSVDAYAASQQVSVKGMLTAISGSSGYTESYGYENLLNENAGSWRTNEKANVPEFEYYGAYGYYVTFYSETPILPTAYKLRTSAAINEPSSWVLCGHNHDYELPQFLDDGYSVDEYWTELTMETKSDRAYKYFTLIVTNTFGSDIMQLDDFVLYGQPLCEGLTATDGSPCESDRIKIHFKYNNFFEDIINRIE